MDATVTAPSGMADRVIDVLRAHEPELRAAGIASLSLFGSVARGTDTAESDVDLLARLDPDARIDLVDLVRLERQLAELLGRPVDLLTDPIQKPRLRVIVERERRLAF